MGGATTQLVTSGVRPGGTVLIYGALSGPTLTLNTFDIFLRKRLEVPCSPALECKSSAECLRSTTRSLPGAWSIHNINPEVDTTVLHTCAGIHAACVAGWTGGEPGGHACCSVGADGGWHAQALLRLATEHGSP